jgi:hypothetical protein
MAVAGQAFQGWHRRADSYQVDAFANRPANGRLDTLVGAQRGGVKEAEMIMQRTAKEIENLRPSQKHARRLSSSLAGAHAFAWEMCFQLRLSSASVVVAVQQAFLRRPQRNALQLT